MSDSAAINDAFDTHPLEMTSNDLKRKPKHIRPKKKRLRESILKQMEFYFSDAALSKDRYLGSLVKEDPFVSLEVFLKFNKIRELTKNVNDISKAVKYSISLVLSEDGLKVRRLTPLLPYNADDRTVYVESIPSTAGLPWLSSVFGKYGPIAYISLPKFHKSNRIKGFAFIEYTSGDSANNCIKAFAELGCKLPTNLAPNELSSVKNFELPAEKENALMYQKKIVGVIKIKNKKDEESVSIENSKEINQAKKKIPKRGRKSETQDEKGDSKDPDIKSPIIKKQKIDCENDDTNVQHEKCTVEESQQDVKSVELKKKKHKPELDAKKVKNKSTEEAAQVQENHEESEEQPAKKSKTFRSKKMRKDSGKDNKPNTEEKETVVPSEDEKEYESSKPDPSDTEDNEIEKVKKGVRNRSIKTRKKAKIHHEVLPEGLELGLQVLSKPEWKVLRNRYLNLQRKNYTEMKEALRSKTTNLHCETEPSLPIIENEETTKLSEAKLSKYARKCPEKCSGIIVSVNLPEPCLNVREMKSSTKSNVHVMHVEVKEGQTCMFVRFDEATYAKQFVESSIFKDAKILEGQEEEVHWERIKKDWECRANGGKRRMRGGDRLRLKVTQSSSTAKSDRPPSNPSNPSNTPASQAAGKHMRFDD